jgi:pimeloyl-ACP methyl ester carboxylesterase
MPEFVPEIDGVFLEPWECVTSSGLVWRGYQTPITGKPVLHFVHGNGFNGMVYKPFWRHLLPYMDVVLTNAQGHGGSDAGAHFSGWNHNADMLFEVLQQKRHQWQAPVIGAGHSFGGVLTTFAAVRDPSLFSGLTLLDPGFMPRTYAMAARLIYRAGGMHYVPIVRQTETRRNFWPSRESARENFYQRGVFADWCDEALDAYVSYGLIEQDTGVSLLTPPWLEKEIYAKVPAGLWQAISRVQTPALLLQGEKTYRFIKKGLRNACKINSFFTMDVLPGDHCFMQQHPRVTADRILYQMRDWHIIDNEMDNEAKSSEKT